MFFNLILLFNETSGFPGNIYLFNINNRNNRKRYEICLKLTTKAPEWRQWRRSGVFIVNFERISHLFLMFLLLILNKLMMAGSRHKIGKKTWGLVTHDILKIYEIIQYSKNIFKCNMVKNSFEIYKKTTFLLKK